MPVAYKYPNTRRDDSHFDEYHGNKVADPYIWLENPESDETKKFVEEQNAITSPYLKSCGVKEKFHDRYILKKGLSSAILENLYVTREISGIEQR